MKLLTNKFFILGNLFLILIAIPITLFFISRQQETRSRAAPSTTLYFEPSTASSITACTNFTMKVKVDPGQNAVSIVDLTLNYDQTKVTITDIKESTSFPTVVRQANLSTPGKASISLSIGGDVTRAVQTISDVATVTFKPVAATGVAPINVSFDAATRVFSIAGGDSATENVLSTTRPGSITITQGSTCSGEPVTTPSTTPSTSPSTNKLPVCTSLVLDRNTTGPAPYSLTFTASGNDTDGTISKAVFTYGDGGTSTVTSAGGIGTNSVNPQASHTYQNAGTYNASVVLTDNQNGTSVTTNCTTTITVTATGTTGGTTTGGGTTGINSVPLCSDFTITPASGSAPLTTFITAKGSDTDGTITKTTLNFGDGQAQDITVGMNTAQVTAQANHAYSSAGSFNATAIFTDNKGGVSAVCSKTVVASGSTITTTPITTVGGVNPTVPPSGNATTILGVVGGVVISIIGGILLFVL